MTKTTKEKEEEEEEKMKKKMEKASLKGEYWRSRSNIPGVCTKVITPSLWRRKKSR
jgi:hypothetical protein